MIGKARIDAQRSVQFHLERGRQVAPGKRTLTEALPVQQKEAGVPGKVSAASASTSPPASSSSDPFRPRHLAVQLAGGAGDGSADAVHAAAQHGLTGGRGALPHRATIQTLFGRHDVSGIGAHVGGPAAEGCAQMGATAYATGDQVAFAGAPDLHTAAHEAAHVVQQRGGVQLKGGIGEAGDAYERHADEVADLVVAGKSAERALDRYAGGSGGGGSGGAAVQHRLIVGGKQIDTGAVDGDMKTAQGNGEITLAELAASGRLQKEAADKQDFVYADWKAAAQGLVTHDPTSLGSLALHAGSITFTNANKKYAQRAQQLIDLLAAHPSISAYIGGRPCFITLINSPGNPASVIDLKKQINIELAYWYFETYELGYMLGLLCHEFAVHPMANLDPSVQTSEPALKGIDLDSGIMDGKKKHTVNTKDAPQVDHIFASIVSMPRHRVYVTAVIQMAEMLAAEAAKKGSGIGAEEITNLLDCFMMDCASILATNDHRDKGALVPNLIATAYNDYLTEIPTLTKNKTVLARTPGKQGFFGVASGYFSVVGRLAKGQLADGSRERVAYQPTDQQRAYMETNHRRLHWIEPDGRCVFGAVGHVMGGVSAQDVIVTVLGKLETGNVALTNLILNAGQTVANVIACIRNGRWADPHVGDIILDVTTTALGLGVTVLRPDGTTLDINGGGKLIIRVTSPLEHYHATDA